MVDPTTPLVDRSFWFGVRAFQDTTESRPVEYCLDKAREAHEEAGQSSLPLRCLAQAAWWAAAADGCRLRVHSPSAPSTF